MIKRLLKFLLVISLFIVLIISCSEDSTTNPSAPEIAKLEVSKSSLFFTINTDQHSFTIKNIGNDSLYWNITQVPEWIFLSDSRGELDKNMLDTITVDAEYYGLNMGLYIDLIKVVSNGGKQSVSCGVDITLLFPPDSSFSGTISDSGSIYYSIEEDTIKYFQGLYFKTATDSSVYEVSVEDSTFGEMIYRPGGFQSFSSSGDFLSGRFDGDSTITGTWVHVNDIINYSAKLQ